MYEIYQRLLDEKGLKNADISRETGISNMTLSDWKRGKSTPKADKMQKIADFLGVSVSYLMGWDEEQINAIEEERKDVIDYIVKQDEKLNEIFEFNLSENNMDELIRYAKYLKSKEEKEE